ncbi:hypothetical protein VR010_11405 [Actinomycetaceae bacterium L2_0104]
MFLTIAGVALGLLVCTGTRRTPVLAGPGTRRKRFFRPRMAKGERHEKRPIEPGLLVSEVATRLRSGASTQVAWRQTLSRVGLSGEGGADLDENGVPLALRRLWTRPMWRRNRHRDLRMGIPPAIAVCRMSHFTGAPTAQVLDSCARGITEAAEAAAARRVALAGPKASARMLAWLPLLGIGLGSAIGASPIAFLTGSAGGRACLVLGLLFEAAGIIWVRRLTARAEGGPAQ